jgi:phosphate transport system substrate-binding protein
MRKGLFLALAALMVLALGQMAQAESMTLNGAGATFPFPVYSQWANKYALVTGTKVNYQGIGSGGGIAQIKAKTVDFGGTDAPLKPEDMEKSGLAQFPMVMGGVVPIVNLSGISANELQLDASTLVDIFMGKISKWDDPAIKKLNPKAKLPSAAITVAHRTDGSGTTFIFTDYLTKVSPAWKGAVGAGKAVKWPAKNSVGGKGNAGVAGQVQNINGAIVYVEYAYAYQNKIPTIKLKNKAGKFVEPNLDAFQAAAANADWNAAPPGFALILNDQPGDSSWPIVGVTWIMVHNNQPDAKKAKAMLTFFDWCYKNGGQMAKDLHYVPMPENVVKMVEAYWGKEIKADGKPVWP